MPIISRAATRKIAAIKAKRLRCVAHSRSNDYDGRPCDPEWAWKALAGHYARLYVNDAGDKWTVDSGGGSWYHLTEEETTDVRR